MNPVVGPRVFPEDTIEDEFVIVNEVNEVDEACAAPMAKKIDNSYYQDSISSHATDAPTIKPQATPTQNLIATPPSEKTIADSAASANSDWFSSVYSWLDKFFYGTTSGTANGDRIGIDASAKLPSSPKLENPTRSNQKKHQEAVLALKKRLTQELENMRAEDEDLNRTEPLNSDSAVLRLLYASYLKQKDIKDRLKAHDGEKILAMQKQKRELSLQKFTAQDNLVENTKTNALIHWVNLGSTGGIISLAAYSLMMAGGAITAAAATIPAAPVAGVIATVSAIGSALGGSFGLARGILTVLKGGASVGESYTKYQSDLLSGEIFTIGQDTRKLDAKIDDKVSGLKDFDDEIVDMLTAVRKLLENQNEAVQSVQS